jgi:DNA primase
MALALDADAAGEEAMLRAVGYENTLDAEVKVIILPKGKDPDDVIKKDAKTWQKLLEKALPVVDYTFDMVTSKFDLTTAKDKSLAVDKLLPIIAEIKDPVRQAHYLQKLAQLVNVAERKLEAALKGIKPSPSRRQVEEPKPEAIAQALRPVFSSPVEEYCLALLLQHPELKDYPQHPLPEYFQNSENREIFIAWQQVSDLSSLRDKLDPAIWEHLDYLLTKSLPPNQIEEKYADAVLRLREGFLRSLATKREAALALEAELGGTAAELAKLEEQGIEISLQLGEVFSQKRRKVRSEGAEK